MAGITFTQAQAELDAWIAAAAAVRSGQSYTIQGASGGRTLTRVDAAEIREQIKFWDAQVRRLSRGGIRVRGGVPL